MPYKMSSIIYKMSFGDNMRSMNLRAAMPVDPLLGESMLTARSGSDVFSSSRLTIPLFKASPENSSVMPATPRPISASDISSS